MPQDSVLSPILFCIMINDTMSATPVPRNLKYSLYADDCALWHSSPNAQFSAGWIQTLLIPFSIGLLCRDLSFPLLSVSALFLLDVTYLICN